jgi:hypothetical protein
MDNMFLHSTMLCLLLFVAKKKTHTAYIPTNVISKVFCLLALGLHSTPLNSITDFFPVPNEDVWVAVDLRV